jgi:hypothetical protein
LNGESLIRKTNGQPLEFYTNVAFNNEENFLSKNQSKELNEVLKASRFKTGKDLRIDTEKRQKEALDTSLTMQEQLIIDLTYQNELAHEKSLEHYDATSNNQIKVKKTFIKNLFFFK